MSDYTVRAVGKAGDDVGKVRVDERAPAVQKAASLDPPRQRARRMPAPGIGANVILPTVSVVVPAHNRANTIGRALSSVVAQRNGRICEIIIVDDASTDRTADVAEEFPSSLVRIVRLTSNVGAAAARNVGIERSVGDLVAFLDSDDVWHRDKIAQQVAHLGGRPALSITGHRTLFGNGRVRTGVPRISETDPFSSLLRDKHGGLTTSSFLVSRVLLEEGLRFDPLMRALEDLDFAMNVALRHQVRVLPKAYVYKYEQGIRLFGDATSIEGRERLIENWCTDLRADPVACRRQSRRVVAARIVAGADPSETQDVVAAWAGSNPSALLLRRALRSPGSSGEFFARLAIWLDHASVHGLLRRCSDIAFSAYFRWKMHAVGRSGT